MSNDTMTLLNYYDYLINKPIIDVDIMIMLYLLPFLIWFVVIYPRMKTKQLKQLTFYFTLLFSVFFCLCNYKIAEYKNTHNVEVQLKERFNRLDKKAIRKDLNNDELIKGHKNYLKVRTIINKI